MSKFSLDLIHKQTTRCSACIHAYVADGKPVCSFDGAEIRFFDEAYACPKGYWKAERVFMYGVSEARAAYDADTKTVWLNRPDARLVGLLDAAFVRIKDMPLHWSIGDKPAPDLGAFNSSDGTTIGNAPPAGPSVLSSWTRASEWAKGAAGKARSFMGTITSGFADPATVAARKASCAACPDRKDVDGRSYCNNPKGCGCPQSKWWPVAELDAKLEFAHLDCPRKQPGFSNAAVSRGNG